MTEGFGLPFLVSRFLFIIFIRFLCVSVPLWLVLPGALR